MLGVNRNAASAGELAEVDAVAASAESQLDAVVHQALAPHSIAQAGFIQQVDGALLQHAGPDTLLDVLPAPGLDHHRLDALQVQQVRQHQTGRAGAHDSNLSVHAPVTPRSFTDRRKQA